MAGHASKTLDSTEPTHVDSPSTHVSEPSDDHHSEDFTPEQPDNQQGLWDSQGNPPGSPKPPPETPGSSPTPPATPAVLAVEPSEPPSSKSVPAPKSAVAPQQKSKNPHYWKSFGCIQGL